MDLCLLSYHAKCITVNDMYCSFRNSLSVVYNSISGNHSAGKSSFINWYIEETIQRTGVAIETQGFTLVTSGKRRDTLTGNKLKLDSY